MKARRILWLYCIFAGLALTVGLIAILIGAGPLRKETTKYSAWLKNATADADAKREKVNAMEEEQRHRRAELSGQDAISMSADVQAQQAELLSLEALRGSKQLEFNHVSAQYQNHMKRLIPIIALLILHLVGIMLFWPRPQEPERKQSASVRPETIPRK